MRQIKWIPVLHFFLSSLDKMFVSQQHRTSRAFRSKTTFPKLRKVWKDPWLHLSLTDPMTRRNLKAQRVSASPVVTTFRSFWLRRPAVVARRAAGYHGAQQGGCISAHILIGCCVSAHRGRRFHCLLDTNISFQHRRSSEVFVWMPFKEKNDVFPNIKNGFAVINQLVSGFGITVIMFLNHVSIRDTKNKQKQTF